jgi:HEAT repeat protein
MKDGKMGDALVPGLRLGTHYPRGSASRTVAVVLLTVFGIGVTRAADDSTDQLVPLIINLLTDKDKDLRALGLQQVREEAKGSAATKQFAGLLPKLAPDAQAALLSALADRGDVAARPAVLEMLKSNDESVLAAAIGALGPLGTTDDVAALVRALGGPKGSAKDAARGSLIRLSGEEASSAIVGALASEKPAVRAELIAVLASRRASAAIPKILVAAKDNDAGVRSAAMAALAQLARPEDIPEMLPGVLKAAAGAERDAAERAIVAVCNRIADPNKRADSLLAAMSKFDADDNTPLLSTLGRVGGSAALNVVESAIADKNPRRHAAGIRALCNWPDATVAERLESITETARDQSERSQLLRALIRVAALHDQRTNGERLALLKRAMTLSTTDEERNLVIRRVRTIHTIESLRYASAYLDKPELAQEACASIVELAHYKELREPNKAEFDRALDAAIRLSKDPLVVDHAQRYKKGQTAERSAP